MSGICGIVTFGDVRPAAPEIEAALAPLKRRGPDGANVWTGNGVALGHALLATTPESLVEKLPLHHRDSGCTITADMRLDNREALLAKLGEKARGRVVGDGELILRAYFKWGEDCAQHLLGDFAFAIWDARERRLFCARDQMGMRQLAYFHQPGRAFVFATEPAAVLRHPAVPEDLNVGRIADFLDDLEHFDLAATFYSAVSRLPPAHTLIVDRSQLRLRKYWSLRVPPSLRLKSNNLYVEGFLRVFRSAVECRLRSAGPVGAMLSGGMDSSSVAAMAAEILAEEGRGPLHTFSAVGPDPDTCPETRAIHSAAQISGIEPHYVSFADLGPFRDELIRLTMEAAEPFDTHMVLPRAVYLSAHRAGVKVVLDGVAGDVALYSDSRLARLLRGGRLIQAWQEAVGERQIWGPGWPIWKSLGIAAGRAWTPRRARRLRRRAAWWWRDRRIGRSGLISREFADRAQLVERRRALRARDADFDQLDDEERARRIEHANIVVGRERYDRVASALAIEPRDPFLDLRVLDFCLSLPWEQLQSAGWPKLVLRRAVTGKLPDEVSWRRGKEHLGHVFIDETLGRLAASDPSLDRFRETIGPYVDLRRLRGGPARERCNEMIDSLCLHYWLESATGDEKR
jgi:asparagine synthase (glutamine-hydrolysing)